MKRLIIFLPMLAFATLTLAAQTAQPEWPFGTVKKLIGVYSSDDHLISAYFGTSVAGFVDGSWAAVQTTVAEAVAEAVVAGKVAPLDAAMERAATKEAGKRFGFCVPQSDRSAGYVMAVVIQYRREHPESPDRPTDMEMPEILARVFPCPRGAK